MGAPIFVARLRVLNGGGTWDSLDPDAPLDRPRLAFDVKRSLTSEPNTAEIRLYNPSDETIELITQVQRQTIEFDPAQQAELLAAGASAEPIELVSDSLGIGFVELSHGYADSETIEQPGELAAAMTIAFEGQIVDGPRVEVSGQDRILVMSASDGGATMGGAGAVQLAGGGPAAYESQSFDKGTRVSVVLAALIRALGLTVDEDELDAKLVAAFLAKGYPVQQMTLASGYNTSGPPRPQIEAFLANLDLLWSIQNGEFLALDGSSTIPGFAPLELGPDQIIGAVRSDGRDGYALDTAANAEAIPGRPVNITTPTVRANARLFESLTRADTYSGAQTEIKAKALGVL